MAEISAVHIGLAVAIDSSGAEWRIVKWIGCDGDECDPQNAASCVAARNGQWSAIDLRKFQQISIN